MFKPSAATIPLGPNPNRFSSEMPPDYTGANVFQKGYPANWNALNLPIADHVGPKVFGIPSPAMAGVRGQRFYAPSLSTFWDWTGENLNSSNMVQMTNFSEQA